MRRMSYKMVVIFLQHGTLNFSLRLCGETIKFTFVVWYVDRFLCRPEERRKNDFLLTFFHRSIDWLIDFFHPSTVCFLKKRRTAVQIDRQRRHSSPRCVWLWRLNFRAQNFPCNSSLFFLKNGRKIRKRFSQAKNGIVIAQAQVPRGFTDFTEHSYIPLRSRWYFFFFQTPLPPPPNEKREKGIVERHAVFRYTGDAVRWLSFLPPSMNWNKKRICRSVFIFNPLENVAWKRGRILRVEWPDDRTVYHAACEAQCTVCFLLVYGDCSCDANGQECTVVRTVLSRAVRSL